MTWRPLNTETEARPERGALIALNHAVWRVTEVIDLPFNDADRDIWINHGMPDPVTWRRRPYRIHVDFVGGARPNWAPPDGPVQPSQADVRTDNYHPLLWRVYRSRERWPQCSCCGEPMPCRAELEDQEVSTSLGRIAELEQIKSGHCWQCKEPIGTRQRSVTYPGDNLDLPGASAPRFHTRAACAWAAKAYELRWIAVDPRRERILTWPKCPGLLIVHGDGSSECHDGTGPLGFEHDRAADCRGYLTHDHGSRMACYAAGTHLADGASAPICARGCTSAGHPGTRAAKRPPRVPAAHIPAFSERESR